jgi:predicted GNAT superfamily acetyltransferase
MSSTSQSPQIQPVHSATEPLLTLNNNHSVELSPLTLSELDQIIRASFFSATINDSDALLISFDQSFPHEHENVTWLRAHFQNIRTQNSDLDKDGRDKFAYVDRVVVSPAARGKGYARAHYTDLFARAKSAGHTRIVCEVNLDPPNPVSDSFHASLGFHEIGHAPIRGHAKTVRYLLRPL